MNDDGNEKTPAKIPSGVTGKGFRPGQSGNPSGRPRKGLLCLSINARYTQSGARPRWSFRCSVSRSQEPPATSEAD